MSKLFTFFTKPFGFILLFFIVFLFRAEHELYFPQIDSDYSVQIEAAKNFTEGKGFVNCETKTKDLSQTISIPLQFWPVSFPMLLVGSWHLFHNWIAAAVFWQLLSLALLLGSGLGILRCLGVSIQIRALFLLFFGLIPSPFYYWGATDMLTAALFMSCVWIILKQEHRQLFSWTSFFWLGLLSGLCAILRFAYLPNQVILPLLFLTLGILRKNKRMYAGALITGGVSFILTFLFFHTYKIDSSRTSFTQTIMHGHLLWENLKWFDQFPLKAFFYTIPIEYRLPSGHPGFIRLARIGLWLGAIFIIVLFVRKFLGSDKAQGYYNSKDQKERALFTFFAFFIIMTAVVVSVLILESLSTGTEIADFVPPWMPKQWTFVMATRYFAIPVLSIQLMLFILLSRINTSDSKIVRVSAYTLLTCSLSYSILFDCYTELQLHRSGGNGGGSLWVNEKENLEVLKEINRCSTQENKPVVYSNFELTGRGIPLMLFSNGIICMEYKTILQGNFKSTKPIILLIKIHSKDKRPAEEENFVATYNPRLILSAKNSSLYRLDL
jgi:hypothetical protein